MFAVTVLFSVRTINTFTYLRAYGFANEHTAIILTK